MTEPLTIDPMRLLPDPEGQPPAFLRLSPEEQQWRGRYYLMVWTMGGSAEFAWANALDSDPEAVAEIRKIVATTSDALIVANVRARQQEERGGPAE
jgi:hypothetical protein